jgi:hypothetical protein
MGMITSELGSSHPSDQLLERSEVPLNLSWDIIYSEEIQCSVLVNGSESTYSRVNDTLELTFLNKSKGIYNISVVLVQVSNNFTYIDTIWIEIAEDKAEPIDIPLPFILLAGGGGIVIISGLFVSRKQIMSLIQNRRNLS